MEIGILKFKIKKHSILFCDISYCNRTSYTLFKSHLSLIEINVDSISSIYCSRKQQNNCFYPHCFQHMTWVKSLCYYCAMIWIMHSKSVHKLHQIYCTVQNTLTCRSGPWILKGVYM